MKYIVTIELEMKDTLFDDLAEYVLGMPYSEVITAGNKKYGESWVPSDEDFIEEVFKMRFGNAKCETRYDKEERQ